MKKSECQPHYTQFFASVVFDLIEKGTDQKSEGFEDIWLTKVIQSQADIFQDIYDQLTNFQRVILHTLAKIKDEGIFSQDARDKYRLPAGSTINEALKALQKKALIYKSDEKYNFSNPVLKEWLLTLG